MLTIRDYKNNEYPLLAVKSINEELNGQHSIELKVPQQKNNKIDLKHIDKLWTTIFQTVEYRIVYLKQITKGDSFYLDVRAIPLFYFDMDKQIVHDNKDGHYTAKNAFDVVFNGSGYQYVLVDFVESLQIEGFGKGETRFEMFKRLIERFGLEFYIVGKTVYLKKLIGNDTHFQYRYKLNASNVSKSIDASNYFTHIKGFGNFEEGSEDYLKDAKLKREFTSPLASVLGLYEGKPIVDGRIKDTVTMDANLKRAVEESLEISIDGNLHDVRSIYAEAVPTIGDRVFLIDERIDLEQEIRIYKLKRTYDVNDKLIDCEVTFGSQNIRDRYKSNLNSAARDFKALMNGNIKLPTWSLEATAREMINKIHASQSEILFGDFGMQAISKTNPNHILGVNSAGLYISEDGGRTARLAMTAEGIVADAITTGTLRTIIVDGVEIHGSEYFGGTYNGGKFIGNEFEGGSFTGGTVKGAVIISQASDTVYTRIEGAHLKSRGRYRREWRGESSTNDTEIRLRDGIIALRNFTKGWSLYLNDYGFSTFQNAEGTADVDASGYIEFHSKDYSPTGSGSGLTIGSVAGRVALETDNSRIHLNTGGAYVVVGDKNENLYPIMASAFSQSSRRNLKRDVKDFTDNATEIIKEIKIKEYKRLTNGESTLFDQWQIGPMVDESPREILANGDSVDLYSYINILAKGMQETFERIDKLEEMSV